MKVRYSLIGLALGALLLGVAAERPPVAAVNDARMLNAASDPDNWLVNGGDFQGRHYSSLDQVNQTTISRLGPAWSFDFDTWRGQESEPLVVDGVMYVTTAWSKVYALDATSGKQLWFFDPQIPKERGVDACCDVVNRGAAVYKGRVFFGTVDGRLIALDARTGKQVWSVQTTPTDRAYTITGAPRVIKDKVIIGNGGGEFDARGFVTAYDTTTGKKVWRFYLVPGDPAKPDHEVSDETL
jgi:quinohemoprotein ethanol dehydrogenase